VINLLSDLRDDWGLGLVVVAHDLAVAWHIADEIAVMQAGHVVEQGPPEVVLKSPQHPYTAKLVAAIPGSEGVATQATPSRAVSS
jgi:ABC-type dipeptide/oligopeptide/nickel transport system ATPase component